MRVIYDIGSNNGDDIPYYIQKADLVVAVEANPILAQKITCRFTEAIASNKLVIEPSVITVGGNGEHVPFYIHKTWDVQSQFVKPNPSEIENFEKVILPSKPMIELFHTYGTPHYVKIDIEGYDQALLKEMFDQKIFPPYLSAESHSIEVFSRLVCGGYNSFKLVDGATVADIFSNHPISTQEGIVQHQFPNHSAGPFGNDIPGVWQKPNSFFKTLATAGLGWKDIHVSNVDQATH